MTVKRNDTVDTVKGFLILSVILGHLMSGGQPVTRFIIDLLYTFHMALFFGVSGYLLKKELFTLPLVDIGLKYFYRIGIPFILAYVIYSLMKLEIISLLYPWFHLWFIPAFLIMIMYIYFIEKYKIAHSLVLLLTALFTIIWLTLFGPGSSENVLWMLADKRYYYYFVFMYFGFLLRNYFSSKIETRELLMATVIIVISFSLLFLYDAKAHSKLLVAVNFVAFNLALIYVVIGITQKVNTLRVFLITWIGTMTLPIYLWHVLPLVFIRGILKEYELSGVVQMILYICLLSILLFLINGFRKTSFGRVCITGEKQ